MQRYILKDELGKELASYTVFQLPINETIIIKKSIEFFNDKEPCIIHKNYIKKKLMLEISDYVENVKNENKNHKIIEKGLLWDYLCLPINTSFIEVVG